MLKRAETAEVSVNSLAPEAGLLDPALCRVMGLNQSFRSEAGDVYHVQVEDRGPIVDRVLETRVRRVNLIVYANYGRATARIVLARDHDFEDLRTRAHNRFIERKIRLLAAEARRSTEEWEQRFVERIKDTLRRYSRSKNEAARKDFEKTRSFHPTLFSRAWSELKEDRSDAEASHGRSPRPSGPAGTAGTGAVFYPMDAGLRECVMDVERLIIALGRDVQRLRAAQGVDDMLLQICRKLVRRANASLRGPETSSFDGRRLESIRHSLITTRKQLQSILEGSARSRQSSIS